MKSLAIVLAAGKSSRMGKPKGLIEFNGRAWLESQIADLSKCGISHAIIVLGYQHVDYFKTLPWLEAASRKELNRHGIQLSVVLNHNPARGPFSSLQCGLEHTLEMTSPAGGGIFVLPVDVPCPEAPTWSALEKALRSKISAVAPRWSGHNGHPVLLSKAFAQRLLAVPVESTSARLDAQLKELTAGEFVIVEVNDPRVGMNINTEADFRAFIA